MAKRTKKRNTTKSKRAAAFRARRQSLMLRAGMAVLIAVFAFVGYRVLSAGHAASGLTSAQIFSGMPQVLNETFSGTSLNTNLWQVEDNYKSDNNSAYWMANNIVVNNGLQILAKHNVNGHEYEAGDMRTYSYPPKWVTPSNYFGIEIRAKIPLAHGFWPALWLRPVIGGHQVDGEIDMMEGYGFQDPNFKLQGTLHGSYSPHIFLSKTASYASLGLDPYAYHTWQMVKAPGVITMYVDGLQYAKWTSKAGDPNYWDQFAKTMEVSGMQWGPRLTTQIGGSYGLPDSTTDWSPAATTMYVSYVKVYNYVPPAPADTTKPTVSFSAPASGATVSGTTTVTAAASDNVGVVKVVISVDGSVIGTDTTASNGWSASWNTAAAANAAHTLTAVAYDAAGNTASTTRSVTAKNVVATPPATTPTTPTSPTGAPASPVIAPTNPGNPSQPTVITPASISSLPSNKPIAFSGILKVAPSEAGAAVSVKVDGKAVANNTVDSSKLTDGDHVVQVSEGGQTKQITVKVNNPWRIQAVNELKAHPVKYTTSTGSIMLVLVAFWLLRSRITTAIWRYRTRNFIRL